MDEEPEQSGNPFRTETRSEHVECQESPKRQRLNVLRRRVFLRLKFLGKSIPSPMKLDNVDTERGLLVTSEEGGETRLDILQTSSLYPRRLRSLLIPLPGKRESMEQKKTDFTCEMDLSFIQAPPGETWTSSGALLFLVVVSSPPLGGREKVSTNPSLQPEQIPVSLSGAPTFAAPTPHLPFGVRPNTIWQQGPAPSHADAFQRVDFSGAPMPPTVHTFPQFSVAPAQQTFVSAQPTYRPPGLDVFDFNQGHFSNGDNFGLTNGIPQSNGSYLSNPVVSQVGTQVVAAPPANIFHYSEAKFQILTPTADPTTAGHPNANPGHLPSHPPKSSHSSNGCPGSDIGGHTSTDQSCEDQQVKTESEEEVNIKLEIKEEEEEEQEEQEKAEVKNEIEERNRVNRCRRDETDEREEPLVITETVLPPVMTEIEEPPAVPDMNELIRRKLADAEPERIKEAVPIALSVGGGNGTEEVTSSSDINNPRPLTPLSPEVTSSTVSPPKNARGFFGGGMPGGGGGGGGFDGGFDGGRTNGGRGYHSTTDHFLGMATTDPGSLQTGDHGSVVHHGGRQRDNENDNGGNGDAGGGDTRGEPQGGGGGGEQGFVRLEDSGRVNTTELTPGGDGKTPNGGGQPHSAAAALQNQQQTNCVGGGSWSSNFKLHPGLDQSHLENDQQQQQQQDQQNNSPIKEEGGKEVSSSSAPPPGGPPEDNRPPSNPPRHLHDLNHQMPPTSMHHHHHPLLMPAPPTNPLESTHHYQPQVSSPHLLVQQASPIWCRVEEEFVV
ncbi:unnamed protein product [Cyprideis torosa]|uniref:Uncharacterized protein n=1 Tax=Cyprideis torosa TaxID=163714 RepID=A0A7R8ZH25_9CRUS|nr:unnamed protein product [Cyprideis torosa]CAG0882707.1 unnamed protein product [Cyprideis torosa]